MSLEEKSITDNASPYFDVDTQMVTQINSEYASQFNLVFSDSLVVDNNSAVLFERGNNILFKIYAYGVLDKEYNYSVDKQIIVLEGRKQTKVTNYSNFITQNNLRLFLEQEIEGLNLSII